MCACRDSSQNDAAGSSRATGGFTLVETMFVLVVVGVLMSIVVPVVTPGRWRSDSAVHELALALNAVQRLAVLRQHDVVVTFDATDRRITLHRDMDNDGVVDAGEDVRVQELPETVGFGAGGAPALPGVLAPLSAGPGGDATLTFHRNGSASASGVVYLRPLEGSMAGAAEGVRAVTVERATGQVHCYSLRTGIWEAAC